MIDDTANFFEIEADYVTFWGLDIIARSIPLTKDIRENARNLRLPYSEVVEIIDDETVQFFIDTYRT